MEPAQLLNELDQLLESVGTAILATVDADGGPRMRWMTPTMLRDRPGSLFALTRPDSAKALQVVVQPEAEWMVQDRALRTVMNVQGVLHVVDNPALKAEVVEALGSRLRTFWRVNPEETKTVVLETQITDLQLFRTMQGVREVLTLRPDDESGKGKG